MSTGTPGDGFAQSLQEVLKTGEPRILTRREASQFCDELFFVVNAEMIALSQERRHAISAAYNCPLLLD